MNIAHPSVRPKHSLSLSESRTRAVAKVSACEKLLLLSLFLAIFEGAARKWVFQGSTAIGYALYFSKDFAFAAALLFAKPENSIAKKSVFRASTLLGISLSLAGALLSALVDLNPVGAILTIRAIVGLPLLALLATSRCSQISIEKLVWLVALASIFNFALGSMQFYLPAEHVLNTYADSALNVVSFNYSVRATGTFSYISGMGVISTFGVWAGLCLMSGSRGFSFGAGLLSVFAGLGCAFVSISRGPVVIGALLFGLWILFSGLWLLKPIPAIVGISIALGISVFSSGTELSQNLFSTLLSRHAEAQEGESLASRTSEPLLLTFDVIALAPFGAGLGTEQVAGVWASTGEANFSNYEAPWPRLGLEAGFLGILGFAITCAGTLAALWRASRGSGSPRYRGVALATLFTTASFFATNVLFNHVASGMLWPIIGVVLAGATGQEEKKRALR